MNVQSDFDSDTALGLMERLNSPDEAHVLNALLDLETDLRARLQSYGNPSHGRWFDSVAATMLESATVQAASHQVEVLTLLVQWYFKEGRLTQGLMLAKKATQLARRAKAPGALRRALNLLGAVYTKSMDHPHAIAAYAEALGIAERLGDRTGICNTLVNLASARFDLGLLDESIALNRYIIALAAGDPTFQTAATSASHNTALALELLGDLEGAQRQCEMSQRGSQNFTGAFWELQLVFSDATYARILIRQGKLEDARPVIRTLETRAEKLGGRPSRVHLDLTKALWDAATGNPQEAISTVERLRETVPQNEPIYRDVLQVAHLCYQYAGKDERYYEDRHLQLLASWQRSVARQQVGALQRSVRTRGNLSDIEADSLPAEAKQQLVSRAQIRRLRKDLLAQVESLATLAELREASTGEHSIRVGWLSGKLARWVGRDDKFSSKLELAARLHDIGKLAVPDAALLKKGKLSPGETEIVRRHALEGGAMLTDILATANDCLGLARSTEDLTLRLAAEVALHHHERWDGNGYPRGIAGQAIPESARIVAIADAFDELTQSRPYRDVVSVDRALEQIAEQADKQFDPYLAIEFGNMVVEIQRRGGPDAGILLGTSPGNGSPLMRAHRMVSRILQSAEAKQSGLVSNDKWGTAPHPTRH